MPVKRLVPAGAEAWVSVSSIYLAVDADLSLIVPSRHHGWLGAYLRKEMM